MIQRRCAFHDWENVFLSRWISRSLLFRRWVCRASFVLWGACIGLGTILPGPVLAQSEDQITPVEVDESSSVIDLTHSTALYLKHANQVRFLQVTRQRRPDQEIWTGIVLRNSTDKPLDRRFVLRHPTLTGSGILGPPKETPIIEKAILTEAVQSKTTQPISFAQKSDQFISLTLPAKSETILALRFSTPPKASALLLWEPRAYEDHARFNILVHGALTGCLFVIGLVLISVRIYTKTSMCLWSGLLALCIGLYLATHFGYFANVISILGFLHVSVADLCLTLAVVAAMELLLQVLEFGPADTFQERLVETTQYAALFLLLIVLLGVPEAGSIVRLFVVVGLAIALLIIPMQLNKSLAGAGLILPGVLVIAIACAGAGALSFSAGLPSVLTFEPLAYSVAVIGVALLCSSTILMTVSAVRQGRPSLVSRNRRRRKRKKSHRASAFGAPGEGSVPGPEVGPASAPISQHSGEIQAESDAELSEEPNFGEDMRPSPIDDRFVTAMTAAKEGLWDWDIEHDVIQLSPYVSELIGTTDQVEMMSESEWFACIHPDDQETYRKAMDNYLRSGDPSFKVQFRVRGLDGQNTLLELRGTNFESGIDQTPHCVGVLREIIIDDSTLADDVERIDQRLDDLTGLPNRDQFVDLVHQAISNYRHHGTSPVGVSKPAILSVGVDRFKAFNEALGEDRADQVFVSLSERLASALGTGDVIARLGGDEFGVLTRLREDEDVKDLSALLKDLSLQPMDMDGTEIFPGVTIGIAVCHDTEQTAQSLITEAQQALHEARKKGQGEIQVYAPGMGVDRSKELAFESELRRALDNHEMEIYYQPIMDLRDGRIAGFESLIRWNHPTQGLLSPAQFVPHAEELGLIKPLGLFCLSMTSLQLSQWQEFFVLDKPLFASVNISTKQLLDDDLLVEFRHLVESVNLAPNSLKLEVTESQLIQNEDQARRILTRLRDMGGGVVLDDFGTGHSSLERLKRFPFDTIKIDKSFVEGLFDDQQSQVMVKSTIELAHNLNMDVVAEGVETEDAGRSLYKMGCNYAQGYVFGAPMKAMEAQAFVAHYWSS